MLQHVVSSCVRLLFAAEQVADSGLQIRSVLPAAAEDTRRLHSQLKLTIKLCEAKESCRFK